MSLLGIALSFVGTVCMLYGGIDTIIKIVKTDDGQYTTSTPVMAAKDNSDYEESRKENIQYWSYIRNRIRINKLGISLLIVGFFVQFLAVLLNH